MRLSKQSGSRQIRKRLTKRKLEDLEKMASNANILVGMQDAKILAADVSANKENSNHDLTLNPYENTQFESFDDDALDSVDSFKALSKQVSSIEDLDCEAQRRYEMSRQGEKATNEVCVFLLFDFCTFLCACSIDSPIFGLLLQSTSLFSNIKVSAIVNVCCV